MAESRFNKVCNVLTNYNFDINEDVSDDVLCIICKKIMIDPYSGICGCHYCYLCIRDYIGENLKHCPGGTEECTEEILVMEKNIHKNLACRRNIYNAMIKCPNTSCFFRSKLENIEEHIRICTMTRMDCPFEIFGCTKEGLREDNVKAHLDLDELKHTQMIVEAINHLKNDVNGLKHILEAKEIEINNMKDEIENNKIHIEDGKEDSRRKEILMREEIRILKENQERIESQSEVMKEEEKIMKEEIKIQKTDILKIEKLEESQKREITMMKNEINELKMFNEERRMKGFEECRRKDEMMKEINYMQEEMKTLKNAEEKREFKHGKIKEGETIMMKNEINELKMIDEERRKKDIEECRRKNEMMKQINDLQEEMKILKNKD